MKIMHFIHGLNTGGAETLVKEYLLNFEKSKFDVILLCLKHENESPYEKELECNKIKVVYAQDYLPFKKQNLLFEKIVNRMCEYCVVRHIVRKEAPDILHTHLPLNAFVKFARPGCRTVIYHTVHNEPMVLWRKDDNGRRRDFKAAKWLVKKYGMRFIALHDRMRDEVNEMFGVSNTVVLNNGIDVSKFKWARSGDQVRGELKIPQNAFVVGHVGRFSEQKNHEFLVDVFADMKKKRKNAFLLMVGDGSEKKRIEEKLKKARLDDSYLILSNRSDMPDLMATMDIFVFPSRFEGVGVALIEAQEARLPCFVSDNASEYASISNLVVRLSLDDGVNKWTEAILSYGRPEKVIVEDGDWDIRKVVKKLERLYRDASAEKKNGKE